MTEPAAHNGTDLRESFLSLKPRIEPLTIKVDGVEKLFYVIGFNGERRARWREIVLRNEGKECLSEVIALGVCNEEGALLFDVSNAEDIAKIAALDGKVQQDAAIKVYEVSGLTDKAEETAKKKSAMTTS